MTEEEIEEWFDNGDERSARIYRFPNHWEVYVFDVMDGEGSAEGDTLAETFVLAIEDFQRTICGAI